MFNFISRLFYLIFGTYLDSPRILSRQVCSHYIKNDDGEEILDHLYLKIKVELPDTPNFYIQNGMDVFYIAYTKPDKTFHIFQTESYIVFSVSPNYTFNECYTTYIDGIITIYIPENAYTPDSDYLDIILKRNLKQISRKNKNK